VYEEELMAWFGTDGKGVKALLNSSVTFDQGKIDAWVADILKDRAAGIKKDCDEKNREAKVQREAERKRVKAQKKKERDQEKADRYAVAAAAKKKQDEEDARRAAEAKQRQEEEAELHVLGTYFVPSCVLIWACAHTWMGAGGSG
jgi:pyruvate-formate lyase